MLLGVLIREQKVFVLQKTFVHTKWMIIYVWTKWAASTIVLLYFRIGWVDEEGGTKTSPTLGLMILQEILCNTA